MFTVENLGLLGMRVYTHGVITTIKAILACA